MTLNLRDNAIRLLAAGFTEEYVEFCAGDDRMHELMMDLAAEFVEKNIPMWTRKHLLMWQLNSS